MTATRIDDRWVYGLAQHTAIEPLIDQWVAWPQVYSPVPSCLHLANYQAKTLQSYLQSPQTHVKSCANSKLYGGPFVDVPMERTDQVQSLLDRIHRDRADELALAGSLNAFQQVLVAEAQGQSINAYYERIPPPLRGYVELVYDYFSRPHVRCIESLLYASPYFKRNLQSLRLIRQERDDSRPYYMSTPRLPDPQAVEWSKPFDSDELDDLFALDETAQPLGAIREILGMDVTEQHRLLPLLTRDLTRRGDAWDGEGVRVRYFGHASVLVESGGVSVLLDPFIAVEPLMSEVERFTFADLPSRIDFVLITHGHHDHFVFESLLRLRRRIGCLVVPKSSGVFYGDVSLKLMAEKLGFLDVREIDTLDSIAFANGEIIGAPFLGEHSDLPHAKTGYIVRFGQHRMMFAADSNCLDRSMFEHVRRIVGPISTVFLGMECVGAPLTWVYGPLLPVVPQHSHSMSRRSNASDAERALHLLDAVEAERVIVYALGREPWLKYFLALTPKDDDPYIQESEKLLDAVKRRGFTKACRPFGKLELHFSH